MNGKIMKQHLENIVDKVDAMSVRERVLIFAAAAYLLVTLSMTLFLDPLLEQQKKLSSQVVQQQSKMRDLQAQMDAAMLARKNNENSPLHQRLASVKQQLAEGADYLQFRSDHLVEPEKMASLLEQILNRNGRLKLVSLQTLPAAPLNEKMVAKSDGAAAEGGAAVPDRQVFRHGMQLTVRGSYLDLLQYLDEMEHLPSQMFWGKVQMSVAEHQEVELTLTLYTLSLDKTWLQI